MHIILSNVLPTNFTGRFNVKQIAAQLKYHIHFIPLLHIFFCFFIDVLQFIFQNFLNTLL